ncbi:sporulation histidine kinase inhibitor Sda [Neobacillus pocheonensis]|uniref:sporulation histidine kinase inhibitor Sda n=1 Tax=Neobacillus pocheonensis TaxID=363869 RepID=UPI003D29362B
MHKLSTEQLQEIIENAIDLNLDKDFILLLFNELHKRYHDESFINNNTKILEMNNNF